MPNPLKADPSRTATLRRLFMQDMNARLLKLKGRILKLLVEEDALGLKRENRVHNTRWRFQPDDEKRRLFIEWLSQQTTDLELTSSQESGDIWLQKYIDQGFKQGVTRSFDDTKKPALAANLDFYEGTRAQFLESAFRQPVGIERVKMLAGRAFDDLKGVTQAMSTQINRELVDGLIAGKNPREVAKDINKVVDKIGKNRALTIARTETIRAHAEGQLYAMDQLGVEEVGVAVEWSTAGDDRVCPLCAPLEGIVMKLKEASGTIPRHPNCRCAYLPSIPGVTEGKTRRTEIKEAIDESIRLERKKGTLASKREASKWPGAKKDISSIRPLGGRPVREKQIPGKVISKKTTSPGKDNKSEVRRGTNKLSVKFSGETSTEFKRTVNEFVDSMPDKVRDTLSGQGVKIEVGDKVTSVKPSLVGERPRGWPPGTSWDNADGFYSRDRGFGEVVATETYKSGERFVKSTRVRGVLSHETGHAMDYSYAKVLDSVDTEAISNWSKFRKAYDKDISLIDAKIDSLAFPPDVRTEMAYFLQSGDAGPSEVVAEGYAVLVFDGGALGGYRQRLLKEMFPNSLEILEETLK